MADQLLIGCGSNRDRKLELEDDRGWGNLTTLDMFEEHSPDVVWDLNIQPWPFEENRFDQVHAYDVLEHLGQQGDYVKFFADFSEIYRVLKPGGLLFGSSPTWDSPWLWGDPSHTRYIGQESFVFLSQRAYERQVGKTPMSDFRSIYKADFEPVAINQEDQNLYYVLKAVK